MNTRDHDLLQGTLDHLRALGLTADEEQTANHRSSASADALVRIGRGSHDVPYAIELKRTVTPATLGTAVAQARRFAAATGREPLLITGHVTDAVAQQLREAGLQFADAAGNAYLAGPSFLVLATGRKPIKAPAAERANRMFQTTGLKLIFALLCDPALATAPYRTLAAATDVSLGAIPPTMDELRVAGHLAVSGKERRLQPTRRLLDDWAQAYARTLRPKTLLGAYTSPDLASWPDWSIGAGRWGGEPAAKLLVGHLEPGVLTLYAEKPPARLIVEHRMVIDEGETGGPVIEIRRPFWGAALNTAGAPDNVVPPPLVYADLFASADARCIETAELLYEKHLAGLFPAR